MSKKTTQNSAVRRINKFKDSLDTLIVSTTYNDFILAQNAEKLKKEIRENSHYSIEKLSSKIEQYAKY